MVYRIEETAAQSIKGGFTLFFGNFVSLIVNAVGVILVARMLSPSEYGLFTVIMVLPGFLSLFTRWGIDQALVNFIAKHRSQGDSHLIKNLISTGYIFTFFLGSLLTVILFLSTDVLTTTVLQKQGIVEHVKLASLFILAFTLHNIALSIFTGFERMDYSATLTIISALLKGVLSPLLVYLGYGVLGVVMGQIISYLVGAAVGFLLVTRTITNLPKEQGHPPMLQNLKLMLGYGLPIFLGTVIIGFSEQFRNFLLSRFITNELIGNFGVAFRFTSLISVITTSIGTTFFPAFSKLNVNKELEITKQFYIGSIRYTSILLIPLICMFIVLSKPIIYTLFGAKYPYAPVYFSLLLIPFLLVGIGSLSNIGLLNSQGETRATMIIVSTGSILKIILSGLFIGRWGVVGLLTAFIISEAIQRLLGTQTVKGKYKLEPDLSHTLKTLFCSFTSGLVSLGLLNVLKYQQPFFLLMAGALTFITAFLIIAPLIGAIERQDIHNMNTLFEKIPLIQPFVKIILDFEEKLISLRKAHTPF